MDPWHDYYYENQDIHTHTEGQRGFQIISGFSFLGTYESIV